MKLPLYTLLTAIAFMGAVRAADSRPNIILFLADDMGQGDTSAYQDFTGNRDASQVHTPAMERLAKSGLRFTDGHSPAAYCNPTRISLLRGGRTVSKFEDFGTALPSMLKRAGYRTYGVGKWHVFFQKGKDYHADSRIKLCALDFGFDHYTGTQHNITKSPAYHIDRSYQRYDASTKSLVPNDSKQAPGYGNPGGPHEPICQQIWLNAARGYLNEHSPDGPHADQPFFLYYPSHANHNKLLPADELDGIPVKTACKTVDGKLLSANRDSLRADRSQMIYENDVAISLLLEWLNKTDDPRNPGKKMIANTLFVFSADNGANDDFGRPANGRLHGNKGSIEEAGHREPFIVSWPARVPAGVTSKQQISLLDMFATFAAAAGEPLKGDEAPDSFNMLDNLLHPTTAKPRPKGIYAARSLRASHLTIRDGNFKIIWETTRPPKFTALYDLENDLGETKNLLGDPKHAGIERSLKEQARAFLRDGRSRPGFSPKLAAADRPTKKEQPNIVFILADDLGYGDLGIYNPDSKIPTPHLDRLARGGIRFTDAHSGAAVCSPTRYGLLTGRHFLRRPDWIKGILNQCLIDEKQLTVAEFLKHYGYQTAAFGKWHLGQTWFDKAGKPGGPSFKTDYSKPTKGGPNDHGFDYFFGMNGTAVGSPLVLMRNRLVTEEPTIKGPKKGRPMAKSHRPVDVMPRTTEEVLKYIDRAADESKPFFIYYAMTAIHTPIVPAKRFAGKSEASDYGDFVYQVDDTVGRIVKKLKAHGLKDNTLIIFSSDNGSHGRAGEGDGNGPGSVMKKFDHHANAPWRGLKGDGYEGGHRVPFIAKWPNRIPAGQECGELIALEDFMATCAAIIGAELPADSAEDSFNILPYLEGKTPADKIREYAVFSTFFGKPVIRQGPWVLMPFLERGGPYDKNKPVVATADGPQGQLFNLNDDPGQTRNVWQSNPKIVAELTRLHAEHQSRGRSIWINR